jgi:hypothetical protein
MYNFHHLSIYVTTLIMYSMFLNIRPCKINYLVLRYCCVGNKSAAGLYLSPNKNKYNGKKGCIQFFAPFNLNWSKRDNSNFTLKEFGKLLCFPLIVRSRYFREFRIVTTDKMEPKDWTNMHINTKIKYPPSLIIFLKVSFWKPDN